MTQRLLNSAQTLVVSWPERMDGRARQPSPLVHHLAPVTPILADSRKPALFDLRDSVEGLETLTDVQGPAIPEGTRVSGGTALLKDQALSVRFAPLPGIVSVPGGLPRQASVSTVSIGGRWYIASWNCSGWISAVGAN